MVIVVPPLLICRGQLRSSDGALASLLPDGGEAVCAARWNGEPSARRQHVRIQAERFSLFFIANLKFFAVVAEPAVQRWAATGKPIARSNATRPVSNDARAFTWSLRAVYSACWAVRRSWNCPIPA